MCAKFAPVAPPHILRQLRDKDALGDYHLLLAHDVVVNQISYRELFYGKGMYVIMDHSIVELGNPVSNQMILEASDIVAASCMVLPDYLGESTSTLVDSAFAAGVFTTEGCTQFMAVPQGHSLEEVIKCAEQLVTIQGVTSWGVARHLTEKLDTRKAVICALQDMSDLPIHLLGFSNNLADDLFCCKLNVMGIDSSVPIRLGLYGTRITLDTNIGERPPRGDYWEYTGDLPQLVYDNLQTVRDWIA